MERSLVIVESPAKCRTLSKFLGQRYELASSMGHLIDLPSGSMGVDVENDFKPRYTVIPMRKKLLAELKKKVKGKRVIYLATDPDREGEAISWHLSRELSDKSMKALRVEFHEITKGAIDAAFKNPRDIDMSKVNAQQARRILDRIVGYNLSPLLWDKVGRGLSAGRVQSVALRLIVEREKKINAFTPKEYWDMEAELEKMDKSSFRFKAKLSQINGKKPQVDNEESSDGLIAVLKKRDFIVIKQKDQRKIKQPPRPFTTSAMQQEAFNRLRFSASRTMRIAQQLYEGLEVGGEGSMGLITYMRTDSTRIAEEARRQASAYILKGFGRQYLPKRPPKLKSSKQKIQGAHEAIRPTSVHRVPAEIKKYLSADQFKLYELIWRRFLQSQMAPAISKSKTVDISAREPSKQDDVYIFRATGTELIFDGFLKLDGRSAEPAQPQVPPLAEGEKLALIRLIPSQHFTKPPPRFSEASLVKELEEKGIGRPSTYAPIISTIVTRRYVERKSGYFYPTEVGIVVTELLVKHFPTVLNVSFTAEMENELDKVEEGLADWVQILKGFYGPFTKNLSHAHKKMEDFKKRRTPTDYKCDRCGKPMVFKWSKSGTFLGCSGFPRCKNSKPARRGKDGKIEVIEPEVVDMKCDKCGRPMVVKYFRNGRFLSCMGYPNCKNAKPFPTGVQCPGPGCDGELIERHSRRGPFYGCSKYPDCKYTARRLPEK